MKFNRTGIITSDARRSTTCQLCLAAPGNSCKTPQGRTISKVHNERLKTFVEQEKAAGTFEKNYIQSRQVLGELVVSGLQRRWA